MKHSVPNLGITASQNRIHAYAELTNDFNPLHTDPEFAARTPMGGIIAHGTMSLSLLMRAVQEVFDEDAGQVEVEIRFVRPVRIGDTVTTGGEPLVDEAPAYRVWVRNGAGEAVIEGVARIVR